MTARAIHHLDLAIDQWGFHAEIICTAPIGAPCRTVCEDGCEQWTWLPDHLDDAGHRLVDQGACQAAEALAHATDVEEGYDGPAHVLRTGAVDARSTETGWTWRYAR